LEKNSEQIRAFEVEAELHFLEEEGIGGVRDAMESAQSHLDPSPGPFDPIQTNRPFPKPFFLLVQGTVNQSPPFHSLIADKPVGIEKTASLDRPTDSLLQRRSRNILYCEKSQRTTSLPQP